MPERRALSTTVTDVSWLTPSMIRVVVGGPGLEGFAVGSFTDHYVKCRFADKTRSYTVRAWDPERRLLTLDFVVHGDRGVAGPWAAQAQPGDTLEMMGPGGGYAPATEADWHLMVGDDAVLPAIAVSLSRVPTGVPVFAVIEVDGAEHRQPLSSPGRTWTPSGCTAAPTPVGTPPRCLRLSAPSHCRPGAARRSCTGKPTPSGSSGVIWSLIAAFRPAHSPLVAIGSCGAPTRSGAPKSATGWPKRTLISSEPPPLTNT